MRKELVRNIFIAFVEDDREKFLETATQVIRDEERKNHQLIVKELKDILKKLSQETIVKESSFGKRYKEALPIPRDNEKGFPLLAIKEFYLDWSDILLHDDILTSLQHTVREIQHSDVLASYGLKPKQNILFYGKPGTGKTLASKILSSVLGYPMVYIHFDSIVSSYLGETAANLKKIFNFIEQGNWIVLFDEFDVIGKQRDDPYEHGEIKRIVNNFMQMIDNYQGDSLLISITNHEHLLDPGLWRRFDDIIHFDLPDTSLREKIFQFYLKSIEKEKHINFGKLAEQTEGFSPADITQIASEAIKLSVLSDHHDVVTWNNLLQAITHQKHRKALENGRKTCPTHTHTLS